MKHTNTKRLLVITSYPPKGTTHHPSIIGGAAYAKNTLVNLRKEILSRNEKAEITVLAEKLNHVRTKNLLPLQKYTDQGIRVKRLWQKNSLATFPLLFKEIFFRQRQTKTILLELELGVFGYNGASVALLPPFVFALRLLGKRVLVIFHEVVVDINGLATHLNIKKNSLKSRLLNNCLRWFYFLLLLISNKVVVFDEVLKRRLESRIKNQELGKSAMPSLILNSLFLVQRKVTVIPLAVETFKTSLTKQQARRLLGLPQNQFILLSFGFLAWYKGTDWLAEVWKGTKAQRYKSAKKDALSLCTSEPLYLIIAGGPNPNRASLPYYQAYLKQLTRSCKQKGIRLTGFIPEQQMAAYFLASDLVVFPYRTVISGSAVLSQAFSFEKPFLLSTPMKELLYTGDLDQELTTDSLKRTDLFFSLNSSFNRKISFIAQNPQLLGKLQNLSHTMKQKRDWRKVRQMYYATLFGE